MKVYVEESGTPIYNRIAHALGRALMALGNEVLLVKPSGFTTATYDEFLRKQDGASVYVTTNEPNIVNGLVPGTDAYFFERYPGRVVFVRQDAMLGGTTLLGAVSKLRAWQRVAGRTAHLCLEPNNVDDLTALGIRARVVAHATETLPVAPVEDGFEFDANFIGHVVPSIYSPAGSTAAAHAVVTRAVTARRERLDTPLEDVMRAHAGTLEGLGSPEDNTLLRIAAAQWLRTEVHHQTMPFRGWLLENAELGSLDVFGGDPAYLHRVDRHLALERPGITMHPAVYEAERLQQVFSRSRVSLNLTALQFDHAVINRFHDATMAGGLCLMDKRPGLAELTSAHAEISFNDVGEMAERVRYWADPRRAGERASLIRKLQADVAARSGYDKLAQAITECVTAM